MSSYTAVQNGNFSDAATWGGGGAPSTNGDTGDIAGYTVQMDSGIDNNGSDTIAVSDSVGTGLLVWSTDMPVANNTNWVISCKQAVTYGTTYLGNLAFSNTLTLSSQLAITSAASLGFWSAAGTITWNGGNVIITAPYGDLELWNGSYTSTLAGSPGSGTITASGSGAHLEWPSYANLGSWTAIQPVVGPGAILRLSDGGLCTGQSITFPAAGNVMYGVDRGDGTTGTHTDPNTDGHTVNAALVLNTAHFGAGNATAGTYAPGTIPAASDVRHGTAVGSSTGTAYIPAAADVRHGTSVDATTGTAYIPSAADVRHGTNVDATTGTAYIPAASDVRYGTNVDATTGTAYIPAASDVRHGTNVDATTGTCYVPTAAQTLYGVNVDATTGTVTLPNTDGSTPNAALVLNTAHFGAANATAGTYVPGTIPAAGDVRHGTAVGSSTGTAYIPAAADVRYGTNVDATTGTCYVPTAAQTLYGINVDATTGTVTLPNTDGSTPNAALVLNTAHFGAANATAGTYDPDAAVYPPVAYVHSDAGTYGPTGVEYTPGLSALANWTLIAGLVSSASVLLGVPLYAGGPSGTYSGYNTGGLTPAQAAATVAAYQSQTNSGVGTMLNPVLANGDLSLVAGNDYNTALGNVIELDASQWPDLIGATVSLQLEMASTGAPDGARVAGVIVDAGTDDQTVQFALPHAFTVALQAGVGGAGFHNHTYTVIATWTATTNTWSPPRGSASVYVA